MPGDLRIRALRLKRDSLGVRLDSWKEIAAYLKRHMTTVRRWERQEGLPVHRHLHTRLGSVYAYSDELEAWFQARQPPAEPSPAETSLLRPAEERLRLPLPPILAAAGAPPTNLIGRDAEWKTLAGTWDLARRGQHRLVLVTGEPGIGKTRLAFDFARSAANATVLVGRCDNQELVPFAPFVEVLQWLVRICPAPALRARLSKIDGSVELAQLAPGIARMARKDPKSVRATAEGRRYRMFEALAGLLQAFSRAAPVLLVIEDVHWADRGSGLLLRHLVRAVHDAAICTVVTYCEAELESKSWLSEILGELEREPRATRVALGGLAEEHVHSFVADWAGGRAGEGVTRFIMESTQGNPLFMAEVLRHLSDTAKLSQAETMHGAVTLGQLGLPETLLDLIGRRLSRLSRPCQQLLTLGAVAGREFSLPIVEALADLPEETVLDGIDEAVAAKILREVPGAPGRLSFAHALFRETLYGRLTVARRVRLHHRIAEAIESRAEPGGVSLAELAHHYGHAAAYEDAGKAAHYAIRAGDHAAASLALEEAARYYGMALRALDLLPQEPSISEQRCDLHTRRGRCFFQTGQWAAAKEELEAALALLDPDRYQAKRSELLISLSETAFWLMDTPGLRGSATEAQRLAEAVGRDDLWADAAAWLASAHAADGDVLTAIESDRRAVARAGGIRSFGLARVPLTLYWAGRTMEAVQQATQAVECARKADDPAFLLYALQHKGLSLSGAGRYDEALRTFDEARTFGRRCGALPLLARATSMSVAPLLSLGDFEGAAMRALEARELAHRVAFEAPIVSAGIDLLLISARSHDPGRAESLLPEIASAVERAGGWHAWKWRLRLWQARAELALSRGDWNEAHIAARHVVEQSRARSRVKYEALGLAASARAQHALGLRQAADDALAGSAVARRLDDPAVLLECLTVLLQVDGSDEVAAEVRQTVRRILAAVSQEPLRRRFLTGASSTIPVRI